MIGILVLAAAAQAVHAVRLPPVAVIQPVPQSAPVTTVVAPPAPTTTQAIPRTDLVARLVPDLVIKAIRVDESKVYVLVANEGTGPATKGFTVNAAVYVGPRHAQSFVPGAISGLAVGESKWAEVSGFSPVGEASYPPPPPLDLLKATAVRADADPGAMATGGWGTGYSSLPDPDKKKDTCTPEGGCIKELHEDNNAMTVEGDAIVHGKPD